MHWGGPGKLVNSHSHAVGPKYDRDDLRFFAVV